MSVKNVMYVSGRRSISYEAFDRTETSSSRTCIDKIIKQKLLGNSNIDASHKIFNVMVVSEKFEESYRMKRKQETGYKLSTCLSPM